jgi:pimeloyl-ACP methyl ester carboxylesterase
LSPGKKLHISPAADFAAARERFAALRALDGANIAPASGSRFLTQGARVPLGVVLVHGLTNAPEQWEPFARALHANGANVVIPRLPGHGHTNKSTRTIARVTADELLATVNEAVDIACGAGERVVLAGLSIGGSLSAWLALRRPLARAVCIVPFFGVKRLGSTGNRLLTASLETLPNVFIPWDPRGPSAATPAYGYPAFPTRLLAENLRIGLDVDARSRRGERAQGEIAVLLNAREPACDNALSLAIVKRLSASSTSAIRTTVLDDLPANHDIIDPTNPQQRIALVYPPLRALIEDPLG